MSGQIWTSYVSLEHNYLDPSAFTTPVVVLKPGSPVLYTMSLSEQLSSSAFISNFMDVLRENWKSQDQPLMSYNGLANEASSDLYVLPYKTVAKCTRFSTFVEYEVDASGPTTAKNVDPSKLTSVFLHALANSLYDASGVRPTEAGLQFWGQFASSNVGDKVNLVIEGIYVKTDTPMIPKCTADSTPSAYSAHFGIEILRIG